jgi:hypothetical protein
MLTSSTGMGAVSLSRMSAMFSSSNTPKQALYQWPWMASYTRAALRTTMISDRAVVPPRSHVHFTIQPGNAATRLICPNRFNSVTGTCIISI